MMKICKNYWKYQKKKNRKEKMMELKKLKESLNYMMTDNNQKNNYLVLFRQ